MFPLVTVILGLTCRLSSSDGHSEGQLVIASVQALWAPRWDAECQKPLATWLLFYGLILSLVPGLLELG